MREKVIFFIYKQKTAYEMRISDWSSDVCSSDLCIFAVFGEDGDARGAVDGDGAGGVETIRFACRVDFDLIGRAGGEGEVAVDGQPPDRIARRKRAAARHRGRADAAVAAQRAAAVDGDRRDDRSVHRECAAIDRGRSGIAAVARQVERAFPLLDEAAGARDVAPEAGVPRLVDRQFAVAELDVRTFFALEAAARLVLARDVERSEEHTLN